MITIHHIPHREATTAYTYDVLIDGEIVAAAKSWYAANLVGEEVQERDELLWMIEREVKQARQAHAMEIEGMRLVAPDRIACPMYCDCSPHDLILGTDPRLLLRQCADLLDMLMGGPVIGGGILDELRRVRAALREQGW